MATRNLSNPSIQTTCVAALLRDDSQAERAMEKLKEAGFSRSDIGVASLGGRDTGQHVGFWNKVSGLFGKEEHPEPVPEIEQSLLSCGVDTQQARYFEQALHEGNVLVTVHATNAERAATARNILEGMGADIGAGAATMTTSSGKSIQGERRINLVGEILRVHKDRVQRGEARLRKEVVTETQHVEVPVSREELVIEHTR